MNKKIVIIGGGGHARSVIDVIESTNQYEIVGIIEKENVDQNLQTPYPVIGTDDDLLKFISQGYFFAIGIGQIKTPTVRMKIFSRLKELNAKLPTIISPMAYVSHRAILGEGLIIHHGAIVNAGAKVGDNCIINSRALIEHDVFVGSHTQISTGAILNGHVKVGEGSFVGSGTVVKELVNIGKYVVITAGIFVRKNVEDNQIVRIHDV